MDESIPGKPLDQLVEEADQLEEEAKADLIEWQESYRECPPQYEKDIEYFRKKIAEALACPLEYINDYRKRGRRNV
jgi:hypothetical protein